MNERDLGKLISIGEIVEPGKTKYERNKAAVGKLRSEIAQKIEEGFVVGARIRITDGKYKGDYTLEALDEQTGVMDLHDKKNRRKVDIYSVGSPVVELIK